MVSNKETFHDIIAQEFEPPEINMGKIEYAKDLDDVEVFIERKIGETALNESYSPEAGIVAIDSPDEESLTLVRDPESGGVTVTNEEGERAMTQPFDVNRTSYESGLHDKIGTFHIPVQRTISRK
jgi:hypothetical protein